eukprot:1484067-Prymnesium_polylepis.1
MAAEELAQATRRWRWWSGTAASKLDANKSCKSLDGRCGVTAKRRRDHTKVCLSASVVAKCGRDSGRDALARSN